jgi:hypothetical protein
MAWAKFPSAWIREPDPCPLTELTWSEHRTQGTASLIGGANTVSVNSYHKRCSYKNGLVYNELVQ